MVESLSDNKFVFERCCPSVCVSYASVVHVAVAAAALAARVAAREELAAEVAAVAEGQAEAVPLGPVAEAMGEHAQIAAETWASSTTIGRRLHRGAAMSVATGDVGSEDDESDASRIITSGGANAGTPGSGTPAAGGGGGAVEMAGGGAA